MLFPFQLLCFREKRIFSLFKKLLRAVHFWSVTGSDWKCFKISLASGLTTWFKNTICWINEPASSLSQLQDKRCCFWRFENFEILTKIWSERNLDFLLTTKFMFSCSPVWLLQNFVTTPAPGCETGICDDSIQPAMKRAVLQTRGLNPADDVNLLPRVS